MKMVFISNYLSHHQIPFCNAMYQLLEGSFVFLQTEPVEEERLRMGWQEADCPYLRCYYQEPELCRQLIADCRVAFFGGTDDESYIADRLAEGKPVIRYSERLYKTGQWKAVSPRGLLQKYKDHTRYRKQPVYLLCAGAYVPSDFHIVRAYPGKMLRWGYFPETKHYDTEQLLENKKPGSILWAARMIDWKHPELPLWLAGKLRHRGLAFHMDIIGGGELEPEVRRLLKEYRLEEQVSLLGFQSPAKVRCAMEQADIYLVTSDRQEGWGAVVNEAMNSGCAVIADSMIGAAPFLIKQGENGYLYEDGNKEQLLEETAKLLEDRELCRKLGRKAYETITEVWNAENAAKQLAALCLRQHFLQEQDIIEAERSSIREAAGKVPATGPCSIAPVISEAGMFRVLQREAKTEKEEKL